MSAKNWMVNAINSQRNDKNLRPLEIHEDDSREVQRYAQQMLDTRFYELLDGRPHRVIDEEGSITEINHFKVGSGVLKEGNIYEAIMHVAARDDAGMHIYNPAYTHVGCEVAYDGENLLIGKKYRTIE